MTQYLVAIAAVFGANVLPAFAPPTWSILVWFALSYSLNSVGLIVIGVISATAGRAALAFYMRHFTRWMPKRYVQNMHAAGEYLTKTRGRLAATLLLFFVSPLSSAQLFAAAGIMKSMRIKPLLLAFALGRTVTYSFYVLGARAVKQSSFGDVVLESMKSPWAIAAQVAMVGIVIALGLRKWTNGAASQQHRTTAGEEN